MDSIHRKPLLKVILAIIILFLALTIFTKVVIEKGALRTLYNAKKVEAISYVKMVEATCDIFYRQQKSGILNRQQAIDNTLKELILMSERNKKNFEVWIFDSIDKSNVYNFRTKEWDDKRGNSYNNIDIIDKNLTNKPIGISDIGFYDLNKELTLFHSAYQYYSNWQWTIGIIIDNDYIDSIIKNVKRRIWGHFVLNFMILSVILVFIVLITYQEEKKLREVNHKLDVSQKKLEEVYLKEKDELSKTKKHFIDAEKMIILGSLVRSFTHDISTPIGGCKTVLSDLVYRNNELDNKIKDNRLKKSDLSGFINQVRESMKIAVHNIDIAVSQIYSFKRIAVDQQSESIEKISLKDFIDKIVISAAPFLNRGNYKCILKCPSDIEITTKPGSLSQVILNLIVNSIIHGFKNKKEGIITISIAEENQDIVLKYFDNGNGVTDELVEKIWEPFFTTERHNGGTGLGLYNVKNLVVEHLKGNLAYIESDGFAISITIPKAL